MGTRSVTNVVDGDGDIYVSLYRQYDGYPDGHGKELAEFLKGAEIGNGISSNPSPGFFNGVRDLACRLVAFFKEDHGHIGSFYLLPPKEDNTQEFTYTVTGVNPSFTMNNAPNGGVFVKVDSYGGELFSGTAEEFASWIESYEDEDD
jgi:hypothetical protein